VPSIERTPNQRWRARYRDLSGRSRSRTFDRKVDATRFLELTAADLQRGEWTDPTLRRSSLRSWAESWFETTAALKPSTRVGYRHVLDRRVVPHWGDRPLGSIDRAEVRQWVAELADEGLSAKWIRNIVSVFALVLELARDAGALRDNPAHRIRLPRTTRPQPRCLTADEVGRLAAATKEEYQFFIWLAAYTGMRPGEMCGSGSADSTCTGDGSTSQRRCSRSAACSPRGHRRPTRSDRSRSPASSPAWRRSTSRCGPASSVVRSVPTTGCSAGRTIPPTA